MENMERINAEYVEFVAELSNIGIDVSVIADSMKLLNSPAGMSEDTGNAFPGGLCMHCNTVLKIARRLAKMVSGTFTVDDASLTKVCLLHQIAKTEMFEENTDSWGLKKGYRYKFADTPGVLKVGERSICMCANGGVMFTPVEFEAMRILDKDGEELKSQKNLINIMSLIVLQANELAYAIEKEKGMKWLG